MLNGKTALITGASSGIGKAIAIDMAKAGANIALNYYKDRECAEEVCELVKAEGVECKIYECDVADFTKTKELTDTILADFSQVDILVNNAGIARDNPILRITEKDYDDVMDINLKGSFNMIKHLYPAFMKQRSGTIINIASVCGVRGWHWQASYAASKGGLISLTKTVAKELASRGVTCNAIAPGFIQTAMTAALKGDKKDELVSSIPLSRVGAPTDVSKLAVFLASEGASYITGEVIKVDGGLCI
ncbi:MAG: 3-oxoacyl-[acyl-carrier-protein] reductase [Defluviitaleaceae bacterium]|nr:3-oxoacyl-[acyl-carrier-protein] reductase [Defluviitaleaceae bacterium]MCL2261711.1 3-oxoacyl-[acyl-carrier-protein] reductase [Defluviitaleaceae bacterium]